MILGLGFAAFFSFMYSQGAGQITAGGLRADGLLFYLSLAIAIFMAYLASVQIFLLEKRDGVIETLLCAPVSLRQIWIGKTLAGLVPAWIVSLFSVILFLVFIRLKTAVIAVPGITAWLHVFLVVPLFVAAFVGLVGVGHLLLGMKENRLLNFLLFVPVFAVLYGLGYSVAAGMAISWSLLGAMLGASVAFLAVGFCLSGLVSRERIVTTIV